MKTRPDAKTIETIKNAAKKFTGAARREFQASVTLSHCHGSPRFARELFGWRYNQRRYSNIAMLQIDLDNGPELESHRTPFIKRIVDFSDKIRLPIELAYYPPYHSKYNPVEHYRGVLESHWSGALLTDLDAVREWTKTMRWDGMAPSVYFLDREDHRGVKLTAREMKSYSRRLIRTPLIERWSLVIQPRKTA